MCGARVTRAHAIGESQESSHAPPSIAPSSGGMGGVVLRGRGTAGGCPDLCPHFRAETAPRQLRKFAGSL